VALDKEKITSDLSVAPHKWATWRSDSKCGKAVGKRRTSGWFTVYLL
jgi:hypothetical protein